MSIERGAQFQQDMIPGTENVSGDINVAGLSRDLRAYEERTSKSDTSRVREGAQLSMVMPKNALIKAVDENKFKNTFETPGAGVGGGRSSYENRRVEAEHDHFGIDRSAPGEERPVYGMLREKDDLRPSREWWEDQTPRPAVPEYMQNNMVYGDAMVDIKPPTQTQHVTTTIKDSLDFSGVHPKELNSWDAPIHPEDYREVQWHDRPVPRKDIEAVHLKSNLDLWKNRLENDEIGGQRHREMVGEQFAGAQQTARDLRLSGLRAPVYFWNKDIRYQPTLFEDQGIKGERTEEWRKKQV